MSPLNPYFLQGSPSEQRLVQDLINEQLKMYGQDVFYIPRKIITKKTILKEITSSTFDDAYRIEAYLVNYEGFGGQGDILSKFGVKTTDEVTFVISKERYEDFISPFLSTDPSIQVSIRPEEGDLIYLPIDNTIFEIKYVEGKKPFYQLNNLYVYELRCEVVDLEADDNINTSVEEVDLSAKEFTYLTNLKMVGTNSASAVIDVYLAQNQIASPFGKSVYAVDLINDGFGYLTPPVVSISTAPSGGVTATAVAIMTSKLGQSGYSISKILIKNPGIGYTISPKISFISNSGSGAIATASIQTGVLNINLLNGGVGYSSSPTVSISTAPIGGQTASIQSFVNSSGTVSSIGIINAGYGYTQVPSITVSSPSQAFTGNYIVNEVVRGVSTGTTAFVENWDYDTKILKIRSVSGEFYPGETIVGMGTTRGGSDSNWKLFSVDVQDEYNPFGQNIEIQEESETFLEFNTNNPFGEF
jgi:hypothetical protein